MQQISLLFNVPHCAHARLKCSYMFTLSAALELLMAEYYSRCHKRSSTGNEFKLWVWEPVSL